ncbi:uncharacterized protein [Aristolochia californica]|uniref:uncharacterized protein n=1 Tax=Aristolochia californica TaxID=171875 RepID=UPI0035DCA8DA
MATCSFDLQFTYVLAGWEGSAADSCVLKDTLTRRDKIFVPEDEDDDSGGELGGGGDAVQLGAMDDTDNYDCDGLENEGSQVTSFRRQSALQSTRATQFRDAISTSMWNDMLIHPYFGYDLHR